jgi:putative flavoprotein involved in K+ transport
MPDRILDAAVVGAGPAGLATSALLNQSGMRHVVLERERIGETWRTQRWNSFTLNSPNRFNILPGDTSPNGNPDGFDSGRDFVSYLEGYAKRFQLPVREHSRVVHVERNSSAYHVTALVHGTPTSYLCRQVIVASGAMNEPKTPSLSKNIARHVRQCHAGDYRSPSDLPDGAVLVVGSAQSGLQVAEELLESGRRVYLSTSRVGRVPRRYRGRDILEWLLKTGFYDMKTEDVADPREFELRQPQVSGVGPLGHTLSLQSVARRGAVVMGGIAGASGTSVSIHPNAGDHIRFADDVSRRIKALVEHYIAENRLDVPPPEPDPADDPDADAASASPLGSLDLDREHIHSIIWATGFTADFGYLNSPLTDGSGRPVHRNGVAQVPGLYVVGMPWLRKRKSSILHGIVEDATVIADRLAQNAAG